jgi:PAS domain S-box-containing protein
MEEKLRNSGLDIIGDVPWGTHFCQFYHTKEDLVDILVPYFKAGLENNELCVWITSQPLDVEEAKEAIKRAVPDIDTYLEKGQMEIIPYTQGYIKGNIFDSEKAIDSWVEKIDQALARGYDGLRASGDNRWREKEGWNDFIDYENKVDAIIDKHHVIALCPYYLDMCSTAEVINVVSNHQFALIKRDGKWGRIENSGRKRAEKAAIQAANNWEYTFDAVPDLIAIIDTECQVVRANRAMAARLGVTPEECVGLTCYHGIHGTDKPPSFCPHRQLLRDGAEHNAEVCEDCLGGYFVVSTSPLHNSEGKLIGSIYVARDIDERKKVEERLKESEEKYRNIVETANEGILIIDAEVRITYANKKITEMLGCNLEELIGRFLWAFADEEGKDILKQNMEKRKQGINEVYELKLICKDGSPLWALISAKAFFNKEGEFTGSLGMFTDITERKRIEEALRQSEKRLRLKLENILSPAQEIANLELAEIVDIQVIQPLMEDFYKLSHIPIGLNDLKGNVLVGVGWQDICTKFHRVHPEACKHCIESDINLSKDVAPGGYKLYKCKNNMWDIVTPIMVGGHQVGYIFTGQFFFEDEPLDYELFLSQARKYGFNEEEYIAALEKVPRLRREVVDTGMKFLMTFANMTSQLSYSNISLAKLLVERDDLVQALRESEKREKARSDELEAVLDAVPAAVWITHDTQALQLTGNRLSYEWLRLPKGANASKFAPEGERPETYKMFKDEVEIPLADMPVRMSAKGIDVYDYEFDLVYPDGAVRHLLGNARPLRDEKDKTRGAVSAFIDITERKKAEEALKKAHDSLEVKVRERTAELKKAYNSLKLSETGLAEAQKMAHIGNWDWNFVTGEVYWSDELYRIFGCKPQESDATYDEFLIHVHPDDRERVNNAIKKGLKGEPIAGDYRIILANGEERIVHTEAEVVFNEGNNPIQVKGTVQDITESKKAEEKIQGLANIVESSNDAIVTESLDCIITSWNKGAEHIFGYSAEEILGKNVSILEPDNLKGEINRFIEKVKQGEKIKNYETLRLKKDGEPINVSLTISQVFDSYGKLVAVSAIHRDITDRKKAEDALLKIEFARQKEIHHRIKNNLQVISSLLDLQADKFSNRECIKDSEILEAFRESQDRVSSIALIHEELYEGEETDALNFSLYIERLAESLLHTYRLGNSDITLNSDIKKDVFFDMDIAVPLGMIVNELITNSLKYAFPDRRAGELQIKLFSEVARNNLDNRGELSEKDTRYTLIVSDNGVGIPKNIDFENSDTLGLQLVTILVEQLDGEVKLNRDKGTELIISFSAEKKRINKKQFLSS